MINVFLFVWIVVTLLMIGLAAGTVVAQVRDARVARAAFVAERRRTP